MGSCVVHIGMPKTGTSSIQESLYFHLEDPGFRYVGLGWTNGSIFLEPLFAERPEDFWLFQLRGYSPTRLRLMRRAYAWRLRRTLGLAKRRSQVPIISAERCWNLPAGDLERMRDFLSGEGFTTRVVVYLRPIKSWIESAFQQRVKWGRRTGFSEMIVEGGEGRRNLLGWSRRLSELESIFGRDQMVVRPFVRSALVEGCAVRDFCSVLGIRLDPASVIRSNESIGIDAVRFFCAHNRHRPESASIPVGARLRLIERLQECPDDPFRFHSAALAPIAREIEGETREIRERYGVDLAEDLAAHDAGPCVRDDSDLMRYSRASLDWLAGVTGSTPVAECEGEAAEREVANQVERLRRQLPPSVLLRQVAWKARQELRWIRRGD